MALDPISHLYEYDVEGFPAEWLPLTHLYDPDLPLFPILYFHELDPLLAKDERPGAKDRVFGFVYSVSLIRAENTVRITLAINKDPSLAGEQRFIDVARKAANSRLGLDDPVTEKDIKGAFAAGGALGAANEIIKELWHQVIASSFGGQLPFGRCWDPVFGLARFIASWYSDGGRKGELIQLHSYVAAFGEKISMGGNIHADFYLLPTWQEFIDVANPLAIFTKYASLVGVDGAAAYFVDKFAGQVKAGGSLYSKFDLLRLKSHLGRQFKSLNTDAFVSMINLSPRGGGVRKALFENYNAFNRGPSRAVLSLLMHYDLRNAFWDPSGLSSQDCIAQYTGLQNSYQSPKVMQLYAQQCFGARSVLPIDNWIKVFLRTPLSLNVANKAFHSSVFNSSAVWGKVERLIWMAVQARKVHSSVAGDILWCVRYGGPDKLMRSANPLSCKVCLAHVRRSCPSYAGIKNLIVGFNDNLSGHEDFVIKTNEENNVAQGQFFSNCRGKEGSYDEYTPKDREAGFSLYPDASHVGGVNLSVEQFIKIY
jgi:hypothetical protein